MDEIDEEERIMLDDGEFEDIDEETLDGMISVEEVEHHDPVEGEGSIASSEEEVKIRSICNLSLVDVEFSKLSFPFIWSVSSWYSSHQPTQYLPRGKNSTLTFKAEIIYLSNSSSMKSYLATHSTSNLSGSGQVEKRTTFITTTTPTTRMRKRKRRWRGM